MTVNDRAAVGTRQIASLARTLNEVDRRSRPIDLNPRKGVCNSNGVSGDLG